MIGKRFSGQEDQFIQQIRDIFNDSCDHMNNAFLVLDFASDPQQPSGSHSAAKTFKCLCPYDDIGNPGLVFQCQKHNPFRGAWTLPDKDQAGNSHNRASGKTAQLRSFNASRGLAPGALWSDSVHSNISRTIMDYAQG